MSIKEAIRFEGKQNLQTKAMIVLFGFFAEIERDLIVERTKEGLAAARTRGAKRRYLDVPAEGSLEGFDRPHHGGVADHPASLCQDSETSGQNGVTAVTRQETTSLNNQNCSITIGKPMSAWIAETTFDSNDQNAS